jgi:hypothetical protein
MDANCLTWIVSLVVAEQKRLASSLVGYMGFHELRAAMEPPPLVMMPSKVVGGEEASMGYVEFRKFCHEGQGPRTSWPE